MKTTQQNGTCKILVITSNANGLNTPIKRKTQNGPKNYDPTKYCF